MKIKLSKKNIELLKLKNATTEFSINLILEEYLKEDIEMLKVRIQILEEKNAKQNNK